MRMPYVLGGSIRNDGPLPEVMTDVMEAQGRCGLRCRSRLLPDAPTMLHSIATVNLRQANVHTLCVDINPAVVTKLTDRGSFQAVGAVTDVALFLGELAGELSRLQA